jgi:hypothetical protein
LILGWWYAVGTYYLDDDDDHVNDDDTTTRPPAVALLLTPPPVGASSTPARSISSRTSVVKKNGFNSVWKEELCITFDCVGDMMDLVFVRFVVRQEDKNRWQFIVLRWEVCNVVRTFASMFFFWFDFGFCVCFLL